MSEQKKKLAQGIAERLAKFRALLLGDGKKPGSGLREFFLNAAAHQQIKHRAITGKKAGARAKNSHRGQERDRCIARIDGKPLATRKENRRMRRAIERASFGGKAR